MNEIKTIIDRMESVDARLQNITQSLDKMLNNHLAHIEMYTRTLGERMDALEETIKSISDIIKPKQ